MNSVPRTSFASISLENPGWPDCGGVGVCFAIACPSTVLYTHHCDGPF